MDIKFVVDGKPMGKQRPRISNCGGFARAYTPKETINYESRVLFEFKQVTKNMTYPTFNRDKNIAASIVAYFPLTAVDFCKKGLSKSGKEKIEGIYCPLHIDCDNIAKIVLDALNGTAYVDDKQVVSLKVIKVWTPENPRIEVKLTDEI